MSTITASKMDRNTQNSALNPPSDRDQVNRLLLAIIIILTIAA